MYGKLATALLAVGLASVALGYGTFAYFSDTETSTDNVFNAGTLDLKTDGIDSVTATIGDDNFAPGDTASGSVELSNTGSIFDGDADGHALDLDVNFTSSATDPDSDSDPDMDAFIEVTDLDYDGCKVLEDSNCDGTSDDPVSDANGNGFKDLTDLGTYVDWPAPGDVTKTLTIEVTFHTSGGNDLQGDSAELDIEFFLAQQGEADLS